MKHQADIAAIKAEQLESELRRLKTALTESSDLQDNARQVRQTATATQSFLQSSGNAQVWAVHNK